MLQGMLQSVIDGTTLTHLLIQRWFKFTADEE